MAVHLRPISSSNSQRTVKPSTLETKNQGPQRPEKKRLRTLNKIGFENIEKFHMV